MCPIPRANSVKCFLTYPGMQTAGNLLLFRPLRRTGHVPSDGGNTVWAAGRNRRTAGWRRGTRQETASGSLFITEKTKKGLHVPFPSTPHSAPSRSLLRLGLFLCALNRAILLLGPCGFHRITSVKWEDNHAFCRNQGGIPAKRKIPAWHRKRRNDCAARQRHALPARRKRRCARHYKL